MPGHPECFGTHSLRNANFGAFSVNLRASAIREITTETWRMIRETQRFFLHKQLLQLKYTTRLIRVGYNRS